MLISFVKRCSQFFRLKGKTSGSKNDESDEPRCKEDSSITPEGIVVFISLGVLIPGLFKKPPSQPLIDKHRPIQVPLMQNKTNQESSQLHYINLTNSFDNSVNKINTYQVKENNDLRVETQPIINIQKKEEYQNEINPLNENVDTNNLLNSHENQINNEQIKKDNQKLVIEYQIIDSKKEEAAHSVVKIKNENQNTSIELNQNNQPDFISIPNKIDCLDPQNLPKVSPETLQYLQLAELSNKKCDIPPHQGQSPDNNLLELSELSKTSHNHLQYDNQNVIKPFDTNNLLNSNENQINNEQIEKDNQKLVMEQQIIKNQIKEEDAHSVIKIKNKFKSKDGDNFQKEQIKDSDDRESEKNSEEDESQNTSIKLYQNSPPIQIFTTDFVQPFNNLNPDVNTINNALQKIGQIGETTKTIEIIDKIDEYDNHSMENEILVLTQQNLIAKDDEQKKQIEPTVETKSAENQNLSLEKKANEKELIEPLRLDQKIEIKSVENQIPSSEIKQQNFEVFNENLKSDPTVEKGSVVNQNLSLENQPKNEKSLVLSSGKTVNNLIKDVQNIKEEIEQLKRQEIPMQKVADLQINFDIYKDKYEPFFWSDKYTEITAACMKIMRHLANVGIERNSNVYLEGPPGQGKTRVAEEILRLTAPITPIVIWKSGIIDLPFFESISKQLKENFILLLNDSDVGGKNVLEQSSGQNIKTIMETGCVCTQEGQKRENRKFALVSTSNLQLKEQAYRSRFYLMSSNPSVKNTQTILVASWMTEILNKKEKYIIGLSLLKKISSLQYMKNTPRLLDEYFKRCFGNCQLSPSIQIKISSVNNDPYEQKKIVQQVLKSEQNKMSRNAISALTNFNPEQKKQIQTTFLQNFNDQMPKTLTQSEVNKLSTQIKEKQEERDKILQKELTFQEIYAICTLSFVRGLHVYFSLLTELTDLRIITSEQRDEKYITAVRENLETQVTRDYERFKLIYEINKPNKVNFSLPHEMSLAKKIAAECRLIVVNLNTDKKDKFHEVINLVSPETDPTLQKETKQMRKSSQNLSPRKPTQNFHERHSSNNIQIKTIEPVERKSDVSLVSKRPIPNSKIQKPKTTVQNNKNKISQK